MSKKQPKTSAQKFNNFMNFSGKGSGRRKEDIKKIKDNWDDIKGFTKSKY